jgi:hypothetical protein
MELNTELFFTIQFFMGFITEYWPPNSSKPEKDLVKIAINYSGTRLFMVNLIAILPLTSFLHFKNVRLLYLLKCARMTQTFELLDTKNFMHEVRLYHGNIIKKKCEDP